MEISATPPPDPTAPLYRAAVTLEASFLTEMLRSAGLGESRGAFGGGIGESPVRVDARARTRGGTRRGRGHRPGRIDFQRAREAAG